MRIRQAAGIAAARAGDGAVFVGATRYRGPLAWIRLLRRWSAMVARMRRFPGYLAHGVYFERPWTLGTLGFFSTREALMLFARSGEHRELMQWVVGEDRRHATGGYIRVYEGVPVPENGTRRSDDAHR